MATRPASAHGVFYTINYIGEIWGDVSGGARQGAVEDGDLKFLLEADLEKLMGWKGGRFRTIVHDIQGGGIGREFADNLFLISNIEALPTVRLTALWFEQKLDDKVSIRVGQIDADAEFKTSVFAGYFISSTFGWPGLLTVDLPAGGPAYPFAVPGIRLKVDPNENWSILLGLFDGDPAGPGFEDPQRLNRYGLNFRVNDPPFVTSEIQYRYNQDKNDKAPAGSIKFGAWRQFPFGSDNEPVLNPVTGELVLPRRHGDFGFFAILDQQLYRPKGAEPDKGIGLFTRIFVSPDDSNLVDYYADGGLVFSGIIAGRPDDAVAIAAAYGHVSDRARSLDEENILLGTRASARNFEALMELTYQAKIANGVLLQPDFQYVWNPGGSSEIKNAVVFGLRAVLSY
jgi:porin